MIANLYLSHRLDALLEPFIHEIQSVRTILVPNGSMRQRILLEIAKRKGIAMGLKIVELHQIFPPAPSRLEMFCLIYEALSESQDGDLFRYLDGKNKRLIELSGQLSSLFFKYGEYDASILVEKKGWQGEILHKLFIEGPWRLPVQRNFELNDPMILFGVDYLPPVYWEFLFKAPSLSIYLFSPCTEFWADVASDRERKSLNRYWKKKGAAETRRIELDAYLRDAPKNLANWGRLGRETLKILDRYDLETEELYPNFQQKSLLKQIQFDLLTFKETEKREADDSIKVILTGSSRLKEIEALREEILRLDLPYHEISVLAPDIEPYVPLIEFVFSPDVPYRISGFDLAPQSPFRQGLSRLLNLGRWDAEGVLALFETPSFYRKQGWDLETLEEIRSWIATTEIEWGLDRNHRSHILNEMLGPKEYEDRGSWENGLDCLLDAIVYFRPQQVHLERFESLLTVLSELKKIDLTGEKTLPVWAGELEKTALKFLVADPNDEADGAVLHSFQSFLSDLRAFEGEGLFPFEVVHHLLLRPSKGQLHSSHLHAVRFSPLEEGASIPAKAVFLIGMDEESFPRVDSSSSLDLMRQKTVSGADRDRYLFLQAVFSAGEYLRISYGHLSADEGKAVGPSLLVQELMSTIGNEISSTYRGRPFREHKKSLPWPKLREAPLPEGEYTLSVKELRQLARHPWKFFLQKAHGIYLENELEASFALQKAMLLRAKLGQTDEPPQLPSGLFGRAIELEIGEKAAEWKAQLEAWQIEPFSLFLRENCTAPQWEGSNYIAPPIEFEWDKLKVRVVGEVKQVSRKGLICSYEDQASGILKVWPEALIVALVLETDQILMLRNGKIKQISSAKKSLRGFIDYYFQSIAAPSPLISDWVDPLLRKGAEELEKKMEKGALFEDPIVDWVLARAEMGSAEEIYSNWTPLLKEVFSSLAQMYPARTTVKI